MVLSDEQRSARLIWLSDPELEERADQGNVD